jgi:lipopolysaccharide biosynthesis regulator YciM
LSRQIHQDLQPTIIQELQESYKKYGPLRKVLKALESMTEEIKGQNAE